jgi:hypothetical protein
LDNARYAGVFNASNWDNLTLDAFSTAWCFVKVGSVQKIAASQPRRAPEQTVGSITAHLFEFEPGLFSNTHIPLSRAYSVHMV